MTSPRQPFNRRKHANSVVEARLVCHQEPGSGAEADAVVNNSRFIAIDVGYGDGAVGDGAVG